MKTTSIIMQTLCVPCQCRCRYCLLSWDGHPVGADYTRSEQAALRFYQALKTLRPDVSFHFSIGYCMDHPQLLRVIDLMNGIGSVSGKYLQMDGFRFRSPEECISLAAQLSQHGAEQMNFTFYGLSAYHDRFAGRPGDFSFLLSLEDAAQKAGIAVSAGVPLTRENAGQALELLLLLQKRGIENIRFFIPHAEGRGASIEPLRLTKTEFEALPSPVQSRLNRQVYRAEGEWLRDGEMIEGQNRLLLLSLTPENIDFFETAPAAEILAWAEDLDEAYYGAFPSLPELIRRYGNPKGTSMFSQRDLLHRYRGMYKKDHGLTLYDVTDERQTGSRRY